jgi:hypothetical protein
MEAIAFRGTRAGGGGGGRGRLTGLLRIIGLSELKGVGSDGDGDNEDKVLGLSLSGDDDVIPILLPIGSSPDGVHCMCGMDTPEDEEGETDDDNDDDDAGGGVGVSTIIGDAAAAVALLGGRGVCVLVLLVDPIARGR